MPLITNDAIVLGVLCVLLALVFITAHSDRPGWKKFYKYVPSLLLCYFLPSVLSTANIISGDISNLYFVSSRYLLPACLALLCLSIDLPGIVRLGPKAVIMFATGTMGIVIGGPLALLIVAQIDPGFIITDGPEATWRGMTTVAGSWIGGSANQAAMKEMWNVGDQVFSAMVTVDVIVAKLIRAPIFFLAVGSQANVGGAASAPIVASAFHPSLAPVGVLLAVLGYAAGTYAAWLCGLIMQWVSGFV